LSGKSKKWASDDCKNRLNTEARRVGRQVLEKTFAEIVQGQPQAVLPGKKAGKPHSGHPSRSARLAKTLNVIITMKKCTTLEIQARTGGVKVSTDVDDLRRAGYPVSKAKYLRTTEEGRKIFEYEWLP
jgi:hypothetical protein